MAQDILERRDEDGHPMTVKRNDVLRFRRRCSRIAAAEARQQDAPCHSACNRTRGEEGKQQFPKYLGSTPHSLLPLFRCRLTTKLSDRCRKEVATKLSEPSDGKARRRFTTALLLGRLCLCSDNLVAPSAVCLDNKPLIPT